MAQPRQETVKKSHTTNARSAAFFQLSHSPLVGGGEADVKKKVSFLRTKATYARIFLYYTWTLQYSFTVVKQKKNETQKYDLSAWAKNRQIATLRFLYLLT